MHSTSLILRARPISLFVVGGLIGALAVLAPIGFTQFGPGMDPANVLAVWLLTAGLVLLLWLYAARESSRGIRFGEGRVEVSSWLGHRTVAVEELAALGLRWEPVSLGHWIEHPVLVFWGAGAQPLAEVDVSSMDSQGLRDLFAALHAQRPTLHVERAAARFVLDA